MIGTIPTVSRAAGKGRWITSALAYLVASTVAGSLAGLVVGLLGLPIAAILSTHARILIAAAVALVYGLAELGVVHIPRPERHAQVPANWRRQFPVEVTAALYGAILGIGMLTAISFASFYVLLVWILLLGNVLAAAMVFGVFGLTRAAPAALLSPFLGRRGSATALFKLLMPHHAHLTRLTGWVLLGTSSAMLLLTIP